MYNDRNPKNLPLELDERLSNERIITRYFYDLETSDLILQLNHEYDNKAITSVLKLDEWKTSVQQFEDKLTLQDISSEHMAMILDTLADNYQRIADFIKSQSKRRKKSKHADNGEEQQKQEFMAFKYSNEGKGDLHEAVIFAGKPAFLKYETKGNKIVVVSKIVEEIRTITPPYKENYPGYTPYEFSSLEEVETFLKSARNSTIDSLYLQAKTIDAITMIKRKNRLIF